MTIPKNYISTYTGRLINPLDPELDDFNLLDISHALSQNNRFTGHTLFPYSVAEHSCRVSDILPQDLKLTGLLHDASEAFLSDIARPVKAQEQMLFYREAEDKLMEKIAEKFNFSFPFPEEIKYADRILLITELRDLMPHSYDASDWNGYKPLEERIAPWSPEKAKYAMIERLEKLGLEVRR